jgi:hypothetical protein
MLSGANVRFGVILSSQLASSGNRRRALRLLDMRQHSIANPGFSAQYAACLLTGRRFVRHIRRTAGLMHEVQRIKPICFIQLHFLRSFPYLR